MTRNQPFSWWTHGSNKFPWLRCSSRLVMVLKCHEIMWSLAPCKDEISRNIHVSKKLACEMQCVFGEEVTAVHGTLYNWLLVTPCFKISISPQNRTPPIIFPFFASFVSPSCAACSWATQRGLKANHWIKMSGSTWEQPCPKRHLPPKMPKTSVLTTYTSSKNLGFLTETKKSHEVSLLRSLLPKENCSKSRN